MSIKKNMRVKKGQSMQLKHYSLHINVNIGEKQISKNECNFARNKNNFKTFRQQEQNQQRLSRSSLPHYISFYLLHSQ